MGKDITIKLVENDDELLEIVPLKLASDSEAIGHPISEDLALEKIIYESKYKGSHFFIARNGEKAVEYACGTIDVDFYRSEIIYVSPEHRRHGIGTALKKAQIEFVEELGYSIWTNFAADNEASRKIHEKFGFSFEISGSGYIATRNFTK